ncbi:MAG: hypothetical protein NC313_04690 [Butyrivibrio sp.]|nr:hypothetical protein [Butyrivibrio sp.]
MEKYNGVHAKWVKAILETPHPGISPNESGEILNLVIYQLDVLDFKKNKTTMQQYLDELRSDSPDIKNLEHYVYYITSQNQYEDYFSAIKLYDAHKASLSRFQIRSFIQTLLQKMARQHIKDWPAFLRLSEAVIEVLQKSCLPEAEISICQTQGVEIINYCLECSVNMLKNPIYVAFGVNIPKMPVNFRGTDNFKQLYSWLASIDQSIAYHDNAQVVDELTFIQKYYQKLESLMRKKEYSKIYPYIKSDLENCQLLFIVCSIWSDVSTLLQRPADEDTVFARYFSLDAQMYIQSNVLNVENLQEALDSLEKHYKTHDADKQQGMVSGKRGAVVFPPP